MNVDLSSIAAWVGGFLQTVPGLLTLAALLLWWFRDSIPYAQAGAGLKSALAALAAAASKAQQPVPAATAPDLITAIGYYNGLAAYLSAKKCPKGLEQLQGVWAHLQPNHVDVPPVPPTPAPQPAA